MNDSAATALMHLEMIFQAAEGDYSPRPGELAKRKAAVTAFILTGQCIADESDRAMAAKVNDVVNSHLSSKDNAAPSAA